MSTYNANKPHGEFGNMRWRQRLDNADSSDDIPAVQMPNKYSAWYAIEHIPARESVRHDMSNFVSELLLLGGPYRELFYEVFEPIAVHRDTDNPLDLDALYKIAMQKVSLTKANDDEEWVKKYFRMFTRYFT